MIHIEFRASGGPEDVATQTESPRHQGSGFSPEKMDNTKRTKVERR